MEAKINFNDFYKQLTEDEQQICDLCRDWNFGSCEKCEFVSRFASNIKQEVKFIDCKETRRAKSKV
jgi:hypothetical protein